MFFLFYSRRFRSTHHLHCHLLYFHRSTTAIIPFATVSTTTGCGTDTDGVSSTGFLNARSWLADVREFADPHLTCILVGNKVDICEDGLMEGPPHAGHLKRRQVSTEEGQLWAKEEGLLFVEASAKSGQNVDRAFEEASRDILDKIKRGVFDDNRVRLYPLLLSCLPFRNSDALTTHGHCWTGLPPSQPTHSWSIHYYNHRLTVHHRIDFKSRW